MILVEREINCECDVTEPSLDRETKAEVLSAQTYTICKVNKHPYLQVKQMNIEQTDVIMRTKVS